MQIKNITFLVLMLVINCFNCLWGQSFYVQSYTENDGLGSSIVHDVKQDTTGRMWFATRTGITVYDGHEWKSYNRNDGLQAMTYFRIKIDEKGIVWCLASAKLFVSYFTKGKWFNINLSEELTNITELTSFELFYTENEINLFVGTLQSGVFFYYQGKWKQLTTKDGLLSNHINSLVVMDGKLYIATNRGISIFDGVNFDNSFNRRYPLPTRRITALAVEMTDQNLPNKNKLWLHGFYWLGYIQDGRFTLFSKNAKIPFEKDQPLVILQPDYHGGIFWGSVFDIFYLRHKSRPKLHLGRERGIISEGATSLFIDREKNIWISTRRGVSKIVSRRFTNYRKADELLDDEVSAILEWRPGEFIFGHGNGLTIYNEKGKKPRFFEFFPDKSQSEYITRVLDLKMDKEKNVWIAASHKGLGRLSRDSTLTFPSEEAGLRDNITSVVLYKPGQILASSPRHIYLYDGIKFELFDKDPILKAFPLPSFRKIAKDRRGNFYFCTTGNGIFICRNGQWSSVSPENPNIANVYSICHDFQNRIWVGTLAGIYLLDEKKNKIIESAELKIDRPVYLIFEDSRKRLWIGTDKGVFRWDGKKIIHYTSNDGLVGQEVNRSAGIVDRFSRVWIGCDRGVSCYEEEFDYQEGQIPPPKVELSKLDVGVDLYSLSEDIKIGYDKKLFIFQFKGISFLNEKTISYRTMLEGYDDDFTTHLKMENPFVRYTNLPSGRYHFLVQAKSTLSEWSGIVSSNLIIIKKPFWRTTIFLIVVSLSIIALIFIFILARLSLHRKERARQEAFSKQLIEEIETGKKAIAHELHDSIGQNLLITKSELQTLAGEINKPDVVKTKLGDIENLISNTIQGVRELTSQLHPHILEQLGLTKAIESIIRRVSQMCKIKFSWELNDIDSIFPKPLQIHVFRIIQEGLNNIVKHSEASNAKIQIKIIEKMLNILIQDNGKGFIYKPHVFKAGGGFGLHSIFERVKILKGTHRINSAPTEGTSIIINIPIEQDKLMIKKRIIIADDHPIVRAGIEKIVGEITDIELVASCVNGIEALHSIKKLIPDVAILDLAMPGMNGFEVIRNVRDLGLPTEFIILTMYADDEYFQTAVDEGVKGYLLKDETRQELKNCIQQVLSGKVFFKPKLGLAHNGRNNKGLNVESENG